MQSLWMLFATLMFSIMSVCVKLISDDYYTAEVVMYRSLIGAIVIGALMLARGGSFHTRYPLAHLWRGVVGTTAFGLWFFSTGILPLATAMTLNYMSPIWIASFLFGIGLVRSKLRFEWGFVLAIVASFIGVALLLRPTIHAEQLPAGLIGLISGMLAALAYMQVRHLGQLGEPEYRVVFYFCLTGTIGAAAVCIARAHMPGSDGIIWHTHDLKGFSLLMVIGITAAVGQMAMTRAYHVGKTLVVANLQYSGIVFSTVWGMLIWNDALGWSGWTGIAIIIASGIAATFYDVRNRMAATQEAFGKALKELAQKGQKTL